MFPGATHTVEQHTQDWSNIAGKGPKQSSSRQQGKVGKRPNLKVRSVLATGGGSLQVGRRREKQCRAFFFCKMEVPPIAVSIGRVKRRGVLPSSGTRLFRNWKRGKPPKQHHVQNKMCCLFCSRVNQFSTIRFPAETTHPTWNALATACLTAVTAPGRTVLNSSKTPTMR